MMRDSKKPGVSDAVNKEVTDGKNFAKDLFVNNFKLFVVVGTVGVYLGYKAIKKARASAKGLDTLLAVSKNVNVPLHEVAGHQLFSSEPDV